MKLMMTGTTGFLGSRVAAGLAGQYQVAALPSSLLRGVLTEERIARIRDAVAAEKPDILFHTAAISDTAYARQHPEESFMANVVLPQVLAQVTADVGCKMVFCSSDQVYISCEGRGPFAETEPVAPKDAYGQHKYLAEERIADAAPDAVSLRLTWLYDFPARGLPIHGNLLLTLLGAAARHKTLSLSKTDYRGVTYVGQLIENLPKAFALPGGVYNFGSESMQSAYEIGRSWCGIMGLDLETIQPFDGKPRSLCMNCDTIHAKDIFFDNSDAGVQRCLRDYGVDKL